MFEQFEIRPVEKPTAAEREYTARDAIRELWINPAYRRFFLRRLRDSADWRRLRIAAWIVLLLWAPLASPSTVGIPSYIAASGLIAEGCLVLSLRVPWLALPIVWAVLSVPTWYLLSYGDTVLFHSEGSRVTDTRYRWSGTPFERSIRYPGGEYASGPVSPSGERHGEWVLNTGVSLLRIWYWYGEDITEGEWHLRNK